MFDNQQETRSARPLPTLAELVEQRALSVHMAQLLVQVYREGAPMFVIGSTGTGKTQLLNAVNAHVYRNDPAHVIAIETNPEFGGFDFTSILVSRQEQKAVAATRAVKSNPRRIIEDEIRDPSLFSLVNDAGIAYATTAHITPGPERDLRQRLELMTGQSSLPEGAVVVQMMRDHTHKFYVATIFQVAPHPSGYGQILRILFICSQEMARTFIHVEDGTRSFRRAYGLDKAFPQDNLLESSHKMAVGEVRDAAVASIRGVADVATTHLAYVSKEEATEVLEALSTLQKFFQRFI